MKKMKPEIRTILFVTIKLILPLFVLSCHKSKQALKIEQITELRDQDTLFTRLLYLTNQKITDSKAIDSSYFLILPINASCPYCRDKTLKAIYKYKDFLPSNHYIIISGNIGARHINSYFKDVNLKLPLIPNSLFIDSTNNALINDLSFQEPVVYFTYDKKARTKTTSTPYTIKIILKKFFEP